MSGHHRVATPAHASPVTHFHHLKILPGLSNHTNATRLRIPLAPLNQLWLCCWGFWTQPIHRLLNPHHRPTKTQHSTIVTLCTVMDLPAFGSSICLYQCCQWCRSTTSSTRTTVLMINNHFFNTNDGSNDCSWTAQNDRRIVGFEDGSEGRERLQIGFILALFRAVFSAKYWIFLQFLEKWSSCRWPQRVLGR